MKIIGVIPARYKSTRMPGKPIADILGKPMIWWVYNHMLLVDKIKDVYVAIDDKRIADVCEQYSMNYVMTSEKHPTHLDRLAEVEKKIDADFYINVNGDEPLMLPEYIEKLIPNSEVDPEKYYFANAMTKIKRPIELVDIARIKIVTDVSNYAMYMARTPIPYPKSSTNFQYMKFVGIQCFSKEALKFCGNTSRGEIESIEDIDEYRFLENGKKIKFIETDVENMSVDTPKDLAYVNSILKDRINEGKIKIQL